MCILGRSHRWCASLKENVAVRLPADIFDELWGAAVCLGLAESNVRAPIESELFASDATPLSAGTCATPLPNNLLRNFYDFGEHRGFPRLQHDTPETVTDTHECQCGANDTLHPLLILGRQIAFPV